MTNLEKTESPSPSDVTKPDIDSVGGQEESQIVGMLGDITLPKTIESIVKEDIEQVYRRLYEGYPEDFIKREASESTKREIGDLTNTTSMIRFRDDAKKLYEQYLKNRTHGQSTTDAFFLRKTSSLWEKMNSFVKDYMEYGAGYTSISSLNKPTNQIVDEILEKSSRAYEIQKEKRSLEEKHIRTTILIPIKASSEWDHQEIEFIKEKNGNTTLIDFGERFSYTSNIETPEQLKEAYEEGYPVTESQIQLLIDGGIINKDETRINTDSNALRVIPYKNEEERINPIFLFAHTIPKDIRKKIEGKSRGWEYSSGHKNWGPVAINHLLHDFGEMEYHIKIDVSKLTKNDIHKLVETYINCIKEFPLIPKKEKRLKKKIDTS